MLGLVVFLIWAGLFLAPFIVAVIKAFRVPEDADEEVKNKVYGRAIWRFLWLSAGSVLVWGGLWASGFYVDLLWFRELGRPGRFWTEFNTWWALFTLGFIGSGAFFYVNAHVFYQTLRKYLKDANEWFPWLAGVGSFIAALVFGNWTASIWERLLLFVNRQGFGKADPVFGNDIGFYVFMVPFWENVIMLLSVVVLIALALAAVFYGWLYSEKRQKIEDYHRGDELDSRLAHNRGISMPGFNHGSVLGIVLALSVLAWTWLARYGVLNSTFGAVNGAGWADLYVQLPAYWLFMVVLLVSIFTFAAAVLSPHHHKTMKLAIAGFSASVVFWLVGVELAPWLVHKVYVSPNELTVEQQYLRLDIALTREAYKLDGVKHIEFKPTPGIDAQTLHDNAETIDSARLWDWHVLLATNQVVESRKPYYAFADVDVDRYNIGGKQVQLMLSVREIDVDRLPEEARDLWQNRHIFYTHGFGAVANPVNAFTQDGLPEYWLRDIPPKAKYPELELVQPRSYFSETTKEYAYVGARSSEFDYPLSGESNAEFRYDGPAGIALGGMFRQFFLAWSLSDYRMLISPELSANSRVLMWRDIDTRLKKLAPFVRWDSDMYPVIADGQVWYVRDGYTSSDRYPYAKMSGKPAINYIRNTVKAFVNAYTGKTILYAWEDEPVIRAWQAIYPELLRPASEMPAALKAHVRYPEDLMEIQAEIYKHYHMSDPRTFFNRENAWEWAQQLSPEIDKKSWVKPNYIVMALPGSHQREYMLMIPFTPKSRSNMSAWLAARSDPAHYGELLLYAFPAESFIQGPLVVGSKMNQDTDLSQKFTLWNKEGSKVTLGDLRVLPLTDNRMLYMQAVYLEATGARMPQLKNVVVASAPGEHIVVGERLEDALARLAGLQVTAGPCNCPVCPKVSAGPQTDPLTRALHDLQGRYPNLAEALAELGRTLK